MSRSNPMHHEGVTYESYDRTLSGQMYEDGGDDSPGRLNRLPRQRARRTVRFDTGQRVNRSIRGKRPVDVLAKPEGSVHRCAMLRVLHDMKHPYKPERLERRAEAAAGFVLAFGIAMGIVAGLLRWFGG